MWKAGCFAWEYKGKRANLDTAYKQLPDANGIGTVRYPRVEPRHAECAAKLKARTLTNLYNERPTWLDLAHKKLDTAVAAAYGWAADLSEADVFACLLELNLARGSEEAAAKAAALSGSNRRVKDRPAREKSAEELF